MIASSFILACFIFSQSWTLNWMQQKRRLRDSSDEYWMSVEASNLKAAMILSEPNFISLNSIQKYISFVWEWGKNGGMSRDGATTTELVKIHVGRSCFSFYFFVCYIAIVLLPCVQSTLYFGSFFTTIFINSLTWACFETIHSWFRGNYEASLFLCLIDSLETSLRLSHTPHIIYDCFLTFFRFVWRKFWAIRLWMNVCRWEIACNPTIIAPTTNWSIF